MWIFSYLFVRVIFANMLDCHSSVLIPLKTFTRTHQTAHAAVVADRNRGVNEALALVEHEIDSAKLFLLFLLVTSTVLVGSVHVQRTLRRGATAAATAAVNSRWKQRR